MRTCAISGCNKVVDARGWCSTHYKRWQTTGMVVLALRPSGEELFWSKVYLPPCEDDCWTWTAGKTASGYGQLSNRRGDTRVAHRYSYEKAKGPIPTGLVVDHTCRNRACVNPSHLRAVPQRLNVLENSDSFFASQFAQTHCIHGHELVGGSLYVTPRGFPQCRKCHRQREQKRYHILKRIQGDD